MLTGLQIRQARALLGWNTHLLSRKVQVSYETLVKAQLAGAQQIDFVTGSRIKRVLQEAGVEFAASDGALDLRLRPGVSRLGSGNYRRMITLLGLSVDLRTGHSRTAEPPSTS